MLLASSCTGMNASNSDLVQNIGILGLRPSTLSQFPAFLFLTCKTGTVCQGPCSCGFRWVFLVVLEGAGVGDGGREGDFQPVS